ncbi:MAG: 3-dehydroquinate synthase II [Thermoplasmata archaeon]|nr:3-dehydroquinate synthase II [Thermoplasmata archaeon]
MTFDRIIVAARGSDEVTATALVELARRRGFTRFALSPGTEHEVPGAKELWVVMENEIRTKSGVVPARSISIESIADPAGLESLLARSSTMASPVAVRWVGERVLPLETLIAQSQGRFDVWVVTDRIVEVGAALGGLEHGAATVVVELRTLRDLEELERFLERPVRLPEGLSPIEVVRCVPAGVGDRVIVDTTSLLAEDEGLLVGSAAAFLFLVLSEAVGSRYTRPRPFRVNAGAAHSYTLLADGTTRYLSELRPGDALAAVRVDGAARSVRVGRLKIERRPLVMVQGDAGPEAPTLFVQEAETVRVASLAGGIASTTITTGDRLLGVALPPARHLGTVVAETIHER